MHAPHVSSAHCALVASSQLYCGGMFPIWLSCGYIITDILLYMVITDVLLLLFKVPLRLDGCSRTLPIQLRTFLWTRWWFSQRVRLSAVKLYLYMCHPLFALFDRWYPGVAHFLSNKNCWMSKYIVSLNSAKGRENSSNIIRTCMHTHIPVYADVHRQPSIAHQQEWRF